jgi:hypothetical protein
MFSHQ